MNKNLSLLLGVLAAGQLAGQDLKTTFTADSSRMVRGSSYRIHSEVRNTGLAVASGYETGFYISKDSKLDSKDVLLTKKGPFSTQPGGSLKESSFVTIPHSTEPGNYFLFAKADISNKVREVNESNNLQSVKIEIQKQETDLRISEIKLSGTEFTSGSGISFILTETNAGNSYAGNHKIRYYLSKDNRADGRDVLLKESLISPSYPGTLTDFFSAYIPAQTPAGTYFLVIQTDAENEVKETNEKNNVKAVQIKIAAPFSNLTTESLSVYSAETVLTPGSLLKAPFSVRNTGNVAITDPQIKFYLSEDSIFSENDLYLDKTGIYVLAPAGTVSGTINLRLPESTRPGKFYLILKATLSHGTESNLNDNIKSARLEVKDVLSDIKVSALNLKGIKAAPGSVVYPQVTISNNGLSSVFTSVGYYLSSDAVLDTNDHLLKISQTEVKTGKDTLLKESVFIRSEIPYGSYNLFVKVDYYDFLKETDKTNNITSAEINLAENSTDLTVSFKDKTPLVLKPGSSFTETVTDANLGKTLAGSHEVIFFLSKDSVLDYYGRNMLTYYEVGSLDGNESKVVTAQLILDKSLKAGDYYLFAGTDQLSYQVNEVNEENNLVSKKVTILPYQTDYTISVSVKPALPVVAGNYVDVEARVSNTGSDDGGVHHINFYLSHENNPDYLIELSYQGYNSFVKAGDTSVITVPVFIPEWAAPGNWNLIAHVDFADAVSESDEENNFFVITISTLEASHDLRVELRPVDFTGLNPGENFPVEVYLHNEGSASMSQGYLELYISEDAVYDENDLALYHFNGIIPEIAPGEFHVLHTSLTVPQEQVPGHYYLIARSNFYGRYMESDETDNTAATRLDLSGGATAQKGEAAVVTGLESAAEMHKVSLYPNPTEGIIRFSSLSGADQIEITDAAGLSKMTIAATQLSDQQLDLSTLASGIYTVKLKKEGGVVSVHKVVLNK